MTKSVIVMGTMGDLTGVLSDIDFDEDVTDREQMLEYRVLTRVAIAAHDSMREQILEWFEARNKEEGTQEATGAVDPSVDWKEVAQARLKMLNDSAAEIVALERERAKEETPPPCARPRLTEMESDRDKWENRARDFAKRIIVSIERGHGAEQLIADIQTRVGRWDS